MLSKYSINSFNSCITNKLLKVIMDDEICNIRMEYDVVSTAKSAIFILIMSNFTNSIGQRPCVSRASIWHRNELLFRLFNIFVNTDVNETLLIEILFVDIANQLFRVGLNTKESCWLYKFSSYW